MEETLNSSPPRRDICERTFAFSVRIVKLCRYLRHQSEVDWSLLKQLIRAGTSVGSNVEEAQAAQSRADFISKYSIALKEARETSYWLRLLVASECAQEQIISNLLAEANELKRILAAIIVSARKQQR